MLLDDMCMRLLSAAAGNNWENREEPALVARTFRGRGDETDVKLPRYARGLILGRYPVIASELRLTSQAELEADLKAAHNQMVIARSYLSNMQVIDAHIFFVAAEPASDTDWKQQIDLIERNETVCRKLVWMPHSGDLAASFAGFIDRSFLAQPWQHVSQLSDAPLDQNEQLVEMVLQAHGLSADAAAAWVKLAKTGPENADDFVEQLIAAMEGEA